MIEIGFVLFSSLVAGAFFIGSLVLMDLGRRLGAARLARDGMTSLTGLSAVEGAVFALMGLVLAFAISGALQRFDERKQLVIHEANAISNAYDRLDLLNGGTKLKAKLKDYLKARIDLYRLPVRFSLSGGAELFSSEQQAKILALKSDLWNEAVAACPPASITTACSLALQSLNTVFDTARNRLGSNERHPPQIIYVMLFGLGLGGSLLAGFGMAAAKTRSRVHMVIFAAALAFALFVVTDIEFPRLGFVRVDDFDHFIQEIYDQMK